jgi:murein DD-endopeptidase MepM/ murein hydrolase activator NlpD
MGTHRADLPGRRRAARPARSTPLQLLGRIPAVPTVLGILVLAVAGTGTVAFDTPASAGSYSATSLTGTDAVGFSAAGTSSQSSVQSSRELALSRDSERQAMADAADAELQQATEKQAAERNAALKSLGKAAEARASEIAKNQWQLPVAKGAYHLTARFGMAGGLWSSNHTGLDFAAPTGTPIVAVANGTITKTGYAGAYGNQTVETLDDGTEIWYCHQSEIGVEVGQKVLGGQKIGLVGSTGNTTGPHLHLEVRPGGGDPVDPFTALVFHGVTP